MQAFARSGKERKTDKHVFPELEQWPIAWRMFCTAGVAVLAEEEVVKGQRVGPKGCGEQVLGEVKDAEQAKVAEEW